MFRTLSAIITCFILCACSSALVLATSDPGQKLKDAYSLLETRPIPRALPAEKLIQEAISGFEEQKDHYGLGLAQFMYAQFVQSENFDWPQFRKLYPDTDTREQRNALANTYYANAAKNFHIAAADPALTHDARSGYFWREYLAHIAMSNRSAACKALSNMKSANDEFLKEKPNAKIHVNPPYKTFDEFMLRSREASNCRDL
ncbi:MAG: hypothetical protein HYU78_08810 [Rhodocyclales bacterium]|nr:hypothetical protein [Rhodocyclales bacterium]